MKRKLIALVIAVAWFKAALGLADERIWLGAKINDKPARLVFDSGSSGPALCPQAVKNFGLKFLPGDTNDFAPEVLAGITESCTVSLQGAEFPASFPVLALPGYVTADFDGIIGWGTVQDNVMQIDAVKREVTFLAKVPKSAAKWARLSLLTNFGVLDLQVPHGDRTNGVLCVDTGFDGGLQLPARQWRRWKEAHPQNPITLRAAFTPSDGFFLQEEAWADQISIDSLVLAGVPIAQAGPANALRCGEQYDGTLGLAALKRLDLVVDGKSGFAYLRARKTRPPAYAHNRLGAVFAPANTVTNQAVAHVVEGSPADEAGVRNGDILLQVDDVAVTSWSAKWLDRLQLPAGTKLKLTLKRDGKSFQTTATLREILLPRSKGDK